jgi:hypothetical protein
MVLWMGEQPTGDANTKDAMFAIATPYQLPDLRVSASGASFPAYTNLTVPLTLLNRGTGDAGKVLITGTLPDGLSPVGISDPDICAIGGAEFSCAIQRLAAGQSRAVQLTVTGAVERSHVVNATVRSDEPDGDVVDNSVAITLNVTPPLSSLPPVTPPPTTPPITPPTTPPTTPASTPQAEGGGGGCTMARADAPFDPFLLLLTGLGAIGAAFRRPRSDSGAARAHRVRASSISH